jgi:hypothetical protein
MLIYCTVAHIKTVYVSHFICTRTLIKVGAMDTVRRNSIQTLLVYIDFKPDRNGLKVDCLDEFIILETAGINPFGL